jgi:hypothetical protein
MRPGDSLKYSFVTQDGTGAALNADSTPTATLRRNGSNDGSVTVTVANNAAGDYTASATIPATYSGGDLLELLVAATVKGVAGKALFWLGSLERNQQDDARVLFAASGVVWFVSTTGSDSNDGKGWGTAFLTPTKAVSVAGAGDVIFIGPGTFALGNAVLNLPDFVSMYGAGRRRTIITSTAVIASLGAIVKPGNNSVVAHLGIVAAGSGVFQAEFGFYTGAGTAQTPASNWLLDDVYLEGDTDGVYLRDTSPTPAQLRGIVRNCVIRTKYDCFTTIAGGAWDLVVDLVGFNDFRALGPSVAGVSSGTSRSLAIFTGTTRAFGGYYEAAGSPNENYAIAVRDGLGDSSARAEIYGGYLVSSGTNALDAYNNAGALILSGTQYDQSKTSGAITVRYAPELLAMAQSFNNAGQSTPLPTTTAGTGGLQIVVNVKDSSSHANIVGASVVAGGAQVAAGTTDGSGNAALGLNAGTVTLTITAPGYAGYLGQQTITVAGTINLTLTAVSIPAPAGPNQTVVYIYTRDQSGAITGSVPVTFQIAASPAGEVGSAYNSATLAVTSNALSGLASISLPIGTLFRYRVGAKGLWSDNSAALGRLLTVPAIGPYELPDVIGSYT